MSETKVSPGAQAAVKALEDAVYYDTANGFAGTNYPIGTSRYPVNNFADLSTILNARKLHRIIIRTDITFTQEISADANYQYAIEADGTFAVSRGFGATNFAPNVDFASYSNGKVSVYRCTINQNSAGVMAPGLIDCHIVKLGIDENSPYKLSYARGCFFWGDAFLASSPYPVLEKCTFIDITLCLRGGGVITRCGTGGSNDFVLFANCLGITSVDINGYFLIDASNGATTEFDIFNGTYRADITNSVVINDYRTGQHTTYFDQGASAATNVNGTTWKDLAGFSLTDSALRICGFKVTIAGGWAGQAKIRIVDNYDTKVFPFQAELIEGEDFESGQRIVFNFPVEFQITQSFAFQFRSSDAGDGVGKTMQLNYLDIIYLK